MGLVRQSATLARFGRFRSMSLAWRVAHPLFLRCEQQSQPTWQGEEHRDDDYRNQSVRRELQRGFSNRKRFGALIPSALPDRSVARVWWSRGGNDFPCSDE